MSCPYDHSDEYCRRFHKGFCGNVIPAPKTEVVYLIGSLRNHRVAEIAEQLRGQAGLEIFDDWLAAGEAADDSLRDYYRDRGLNYQQIMGSYSARHIFEYDKKHLDRCDAAVLVMPGGKSAHLELGYVLGKGKPGYILMDGEPERVEIMHQFATKVCMSVDELIKELS